MVRFKPKNFGLSPEKVEYVPPLPPKPARAKVLTDKMDAVWKMHDALRKVSDGDSTLADVMFDEVRRQKEHTHGKDCNQEGSPRPGRTADRGDD